MPKTKPEKFNYPINWVEVGTRHGRTRHYIDTNKYKRVSRSFAICGMPGNKLIHYDAVFFNYPLIYPKVCKRCKANA